MKIITDKLPRHEAKARVQVTATVRPEQKGKIEDLLRAGVSHFRLNLSHYDPINRNKNIYPTVKTYKSAWKQLVQHIWTESQKNCVPASIMLDTAGPEFRVRPGQKVTLDPKEEKSVVFSAAKTGSLDLHNANTLYIDMPAGFRGFSEEAEGGVVRLADAAFEGDITRVEKMNIHVRPKQKITVTGKEKVNFPGIKLNNVPSVGETDRRSLDFFLKIRKPAGQKGFIPIDYVAQSFVKTELDVASLKANLEAIEVDGHADPLIIPKLETRESVQDDNLEAIIKCIHTAAVMIARGDLANETSRGEVPQMQRRIIDMCHKHWKPVLLATQVYGSMEDEDKWQCSRPEAEDLRSALDWAIDGVVFTAETVKRPDPEEVVRSLLAQAMADEKDIETNKLYDQKQKSRREQFEERYLTLLNNRTLGDFPLKDHKDFSTADMAIAAVDRANNRKACGLFPFTIVGNTVRDMVHFLPYMPIFAFTKDPKTVSRLLLYRGVHPILVELDNDEIDTFDVHSLKKLMLEAMTKFKIGGGNSVGIGSMAHPISGREGADTLVWIRNPSG